MLADNRGDVDARVLELARAGRNRDACALLTKAYGAEVLGACVSKMGDRESAEDAAQDALARALVALPAYRGTGGLRTWIHRIAANRCIDLIRSRKSRNQRVFDGVEIGSLAAPPEPMPNEIAEARVVHSHRVTVVRSCLDRVKEPDRTWVELHYTHGVPYDDIADDAGLSRAAVKQRIWRAMKRVRALLEASGAAEGRVS